MNSRPILATGLVASAALLSGCSTNPETGHRSFLSLSKEEEVQIGQEAAPQFTEEFGGKVQSAQCTKYVSDMGMALKEHVERQDYNDLPWEFTLLDSSVVNAFALPGGKVFFTRGLASQLTSEAQMAGVLGHEIGHVTAEHADQRISQATGAGIGLNVIAVLVGGEGGGAAAQYARAGLPALKMGTQLVLLSYGREEEIEADGLGMKYMTKAGYNPRGQREVMELLGRLSGGGGAPEFLSTHPPSEKRIEKIDQALAGEYAHTQNNPAFKTNVEQYKREFLAPLSKLPPARHGASKQALLGSPQLWCAHCREAAARAAEEGRPVAGGEAVQVVVAPAARP